MQGVRVLPPGVELPIIKKPSPVPQHVTKTTPQPTYVNMHELASMAATKAQDKMLPPPPAEFMSPPEKVGIYMWHIFNQLLFLQEWPKMLILTHNSKSTPFLFINCCMCFS